MSVFLPAQNVILHEKERRRMVEREKRGNIAMVTNEHGNMVTGNMVTAF